MPAGTPSAGPSQSPCSRPRRCAGGARDDGRPRIRRWTRRGPPGASPEAQLEDAELRARLGETVDLLSDVDRQEIVAYLGLAPGAGTGTLGTTRRKRRQRAMERLRSLWRNLHGFHS